MFICGVPADFGQQHVPLLVPCFICVSPESTFRLLIDSCSSLFPLQDDSLVTGSGRVRHPPTHIQAVLAQHNLYKSNKRMNMHAIWLYCRVPSKVGELQARKWVVTSHYFYVQKVEASLQLNCSVLLNVGVNRAGFIQWPTSTSLSLFSLPLTAFTTLFDDCDVTCLPWFYDMRLGDKPLTCVSLFCFFSSFWECSRHSFGIYLGFYSS